MKILFLYMFPLWGNGSGSFLRELSEELVKRRHEVGILAPDKRNLQGITRFVVNPPINGVFLGHPELPDAKKFEDMTGKELGEIIISYFNSAILAVEEFKPDIVHAFHTAFLPHVARYIKILYGINYIITTHGGSDLAYLSKDKRLIGLISDANRIARHITANSSFTKKWYLTLFGQQLRRKISVVVGGVNLSHFKKDKKEIDDIDRRYSIKGKKIILFTGRLTKQKGVIYLVRAASQVPNATFLIVGDGPERQAIEKEIVDKKTQNVIMVGYIPSTSPMFHAFYERSDIFVSPSVRDEALGLTILEAMAARCAVVATKKGGVETIITDNINGILIGSRNSNQIASAVNNLLANKKLRERLGNQGLKTVIEKFSWGKIAQKFEKIYNDIVKEKKPRPSPLDEVIKQIFLGER